MNTSVDSSSSIGSPRFASSPNRRRQTPISKRKIRILVINFQSIRSKRGSFRALLEYSESHIVLAIETWLNPTIAKNETFPESYRFVAKRDRPKSSHGCVAIIARHDLEASEIDLHTTAEIVVASFTCKDLKKAIIVGSLYRPTDNNLDYSQKLCTVLNDIHSIFRDHILRIGGYASLPDIDWKTDTATRHNYTASINQLFSDTFNDIGCEQIVDFPTRIDNTLDIFGTNRSSLIDRCVPLPGISDDDVLLVDSSVLPACKKPVRRKDYLWKRASKQDMEEELTKFIVKFSKDFTSTPVNMLWNCFKQKCIEGIDTFVSSKMTSTRFSQAWCNGDIRRLSRRKKRAFKKALATKKQSD